MSSTRIFNGKLVEASDIAIGFRGLSGGGNSGVMYLNGFMQNESTVGWPYEITSGFTITNTIATLN